MCDNGRVGCVDEGQLTATSTQDQVSHGLQQRGENGGMMSSGFAEVNDDNFVIVQPSHELPFEEFKDA